jgi:uncharacterized membrane protein YuzA (DUF378 family)
MEIILPSTIRRNNMSTISKLALLLVIVGALNWLLVGLFQYDLVASIFGGSNSMLSRIIYTLVGIAGIYSMTFLFQDTRQRA